MTLLLTDLLIRVYTRPTFPAPLFGPSSWRALIFALAYGGQERVAVRPAGGPPFPIQGIGESRARAYTCSSAQGSAMNSRSRRPVAERVSSEDDQVNVLLVEDDPSVLEMYRLKLELDGYRVSTAMDGEQGLKLAGSLRPDIIFLDIRLPKMDGLEVLRKLRDQDQTREIPVIILSNYDEEDLVARGLRLGAHEYLIKARTTPSSLSEGIEDWLKE